MRRERNMESAKEKKFKEKAESMGYDVYPYSGSGMYGRECPAITTDNPSDFIAEMGMKGLITDNMGLSYVVYTG